MSNVGLVIKKLRIQKKYSQEYLAKCLGVTAGAICKWEKGQTNPDFDLITKIADFFDVSVDCLFEFNIVKTNNSRIIEKLKRSVDNRNYEVDLKKVEEYSVRYSSDFDFVLCCAEYAFYYYLDFDDEISCKLAIKFYENLLLMSDIKKEKQSKIYDNLAILYIKSHQSDKAIQLLKDNQWLAKKDIYMGKGYYDLENYRLSLECYSNNWLDCILKTIESVIYIIKIKQKESKYKEVIDLCEWEIDSLKGISTEKNTFFTQYISYLYILKAISEYMTNDPEYVSSLRYSVHYLEKFNRFKLHNTNGLRFYYGDTKRLYSTITDISSENEKLLLEGILMNEKLKTIFEIYQDMRGII